MARCEYLVQKHRREEPAWGPAERGSALGSVLAECRAAPLGRDGKRIYADVERYLEFFAIVRDDVSAVPDQTRRVPRRGLTVTRSMLDR